MTEVKGHRVCRNADLDCVRSGFGTREGKYVCRVCGAKWTVRYDKKLEASVFKAQPNRGEQWENRRHKASANSLNT